MSVERDKTVDELLAAREAYERGDWADALQGLRGKDSLGADDTLARTMGLATFSFANLFYGLSCNDLLDSVFSRSLLANATLLRLSGISLVAIILANQLDLLNRLLNTVPLNIDQWLLCAAAGSVILWVMEIVKFFGRRRPQVAPVEVAVVEAPAPAAA